MQNPLSIFFGIEYLLANFPGKILLQQIYD